ncbi:beta strand repeat-containing protein [Muriicola soli]|uniref:Uncharacterized protein n=1 Tax=Muriicola soli TaxID=2507538 RepID=A0A411E6Z5_9FLAO|nr:hypothetical protein [Muriicola soli]QBA63476.1 hypothetical protein EQY75_02270 [Muriicola soli]
MMKRRILMTAMLMVLSAGLYSQIKIGDNPQNLDPSSVLELESSNRVFVITRITTAQMNAINPLPGAMIYNTDEQCLFYFEGTEWINLCDALRLTFTADPIFNDYSTIVITESEDNVNFEVREIRGQNIVDFTITSVDIQNNAITSSKLAPDSVGNEELQDNTVSDAEIDYAQVTLSDFTNDAGYITSAAIVSADAGNSIIPGSDNGAFLDLAPVQTALNDLDVAVTTISLVDNGDGTYSFSDSMGNIQLITTNGLTITNTVAGNLIATITLSDGSSTNINETITNLTDAGDGFITFTKEDGTQDTVAKADITDNGDGTYTFTNNDGVDVTITTNGLTVTNTVVGNLIATLTQPDGTNTDVNETITSLIDNGDGLVTFVKEDGTQDTVAKADITDNGDGTYTFTNNDGVDVTITTNGLTVTNTVAGNLIATLTQPDGTNTDINETITSLIDNGDGLVTFVKEDGSQDTVAKADITDNGDGTYTFTNNDGVDVTITTNGLTVTNTVAGNLIATLTQPDGTNTDINETITSLIDNGDGLVTFVKEDGSQDTVAKADITDNGDGTYNFTNNDGTDIILDFNAAALPFDNTVLGNLFATDVQAAIDEVSTAVAGGSDDQIISTDGNPGNISIETGNTIVLNVEDGDFDDTNELNSSVAMVAGALEITDAAGPISENLISTDVNNNLIFGTDGRLYLNVDSAASGETITSIVDNTDGTFTYTNENSIPVIISKSDITDLGDGTYTFTNNDGSDVVIDTRASSNPYDNTVTGLLTANDVQGALDELAAGGDNQDISTDNSAGNITIDNGSTIVLNVDDADADPTNELNSTLTLTGTTVQLTDAGGTLPLDLDPTFATDAELAALNTDDADADPTNELNSTLTLSGTTLQLTDAGGTLPLDLDPTFATDAELAALNTDDADADPTNELNTNLTLAGTTVQLTDAGGTLPLDLDPTFATDAELAALNTDDADADPTNELNSTLTLAGTTVQLTDAGGTLPLDLDPTFATDAELAALNTDDADADPNNELNTNLTLAGTTVQLTDAGGTLPLDLDPTYATDAELAALNTDDADADPNNELNTNLTLAGTTVQLTDAGGTLPLDLDPTFATDAELAALNTDDADADPTNELNSTLTLVGTTVQLTDAGGTLPLDLDPTFATDAELAALNTDDADADPTNELNSTLTLVGTTVQLTDAGGTLPLDLDPTFATDAELAALNTDDADADPNNELNTNLTLAGTTVQLTDAGGTLPLDLNPTFATDAELAALNTDDADADPNNELNTNLTLAGTTVQLTDAGGTLPLDLDPTFATDAELAALNTDDADADPNNEIQNAAQVTYDNTSSGLIATDVQGAIDEVSASGPSSVFHALGFINGALVDGALGGVINGQNIASITDLGIGNYRVNFTSPASSTNYVVQLTLRATLSGASIQVIGQTATDFTVQIKDPDDITNLDAFWYFSIIDF